MRIYRCDRCGADLSVMEINRVSPAFGKNFSVDSCNPCKEILELEIKYIYSLVDNLICNEWKKITDQFKVIGNEVSDRDVRA